eukprot:TRINITY_DN5027_c0_g1_i1.p1 TRINITY_DN5027_c0_g1~~TRINITY_DN5027_c0_g1_i1.p1  ORF type:complete len:710 (+),score=117.86 TRINITY_DN5027_c0_g1_i1:31-2130(+)
MASPPISLRDFRMCKTGSSVVYSLQLCNGSECWLVARRYSEFLRIHVRLLELFNRSELPDFPPKEPLLQKMFGWGGARNDWMEERFVRLQRYLKGLLEHPGATRTELLTDFLNAPRKAPSATAADPLSPAGTLLICGVRVRLTGEPGGVEVVVRADAREPCSIRLALRPLPEDSEQWQDSSSPKVNIGLPLDLSWERFLELDMDPLESTEACQSFSLEPGSLWQVAAAGVAADGATGSAVCIQLRAPTSEELENMPKLVARRSSDLNDTTSCSARRNSSPRSSPGFSKLQSRTNYTCSERRDSSPRSSREVGERQSETRDIDNCDERKDCVPVSSPLITERENSHQICETPQAHAHDSSEDTCAGLRTLTECPTEMENSPQAARTQICQLEGETKAGSPAPASPRGRRSSFQHSNSQPCETGQASNTANGATACSDSLVKSPKASGRSDGFPAETPTKRAACKKRSLSSPSHNVISFQGSAAAQYAHRIEECQRLAAERVPHRWEATNNGHGGRSVPVKKVFVEGAAGYLGAARGMERSVEEVDSNIQVQQQLRLREDEQLVSAWIHATTGDPGAGQAASGKASLESALASGEVLCDLINAIWPGKIVGIARNEAASKHFRRIANVAHFVQACSNAGVDASSLFVPSDLAEGKNFASVLRCIRALALLLPAAYEGPRLTGSCGAEASSTVNSLQDDRTS